MYDLVNDCFKPGHFTLKQTFKTGRTRPDQTRADSKPGRTQLSQTRKIISQVQPSQTWTTQKPTCLHPHQPGGTLIYIYRDIWQQTTPPSTRANNRAFCLETLSAVGHNRNSLLCPTADNVSYERQQTSSPVRNSRQCLLCPTAFDVCCLPCDTADTVWCVKHPTMFAVPQT